MRVSAEDYAQIILATYGNKGISESSLRAMMDMSMNPPKDVDDAHRRVRSVVSLLKYLLGPHTRATTVYDWALQQFRERHEELVFQSSKDQWFLTKFLYRLDVEFDTMSANLIKSWEADKVRPFAQAIEDRIVYKAQQKLERKCEGFLTEMEDCRLPLPLALTNPLPPREGTTSQPAIGQGNSGTATPNRSSEPWMITMQARVTEWKLPDGKRFEEVFDTPEKKRNFPKIKHHAGKSKKKGICLQFSY